MNYILHQGVLRFYIFATIIIQSCFAFTAHEPIFGNKSKRNIQFLYGSTKWLSVRCGVSNCDKDFFTINEDQQKDILHIHAINQTNAFSSDEDEAAETRNCNKQTTNRFHCKNKHHQKYNKTRSRAAVYNRLRKQIHSCGRNYEKALRLICDVYPYLKFDLDENSINEDLNRNVNVKQIDGTCISSTIRLLGKAEQPGLVSQLLKRTVEIYQQNKIIRNEALGMNENQQTEDDNMILMCCRAAISAFGISNEWNKAIQLLRQEIPQKLCLSPTAEIYHAAISAMGNNQQILEAFALLTEMEESVYTTAIKEYSTNPARDNLTMYRIPKPDRMAYHTVLTALLRYKSKSSQNPTTSNDNNNDESTNIVNVEKEVLDILHYRMPRQNILPNHVTYNLAILASAKANKYSCALQLLSDMENASHLQKDSKSKVDESIYHAVISVCGRLGRWKDATQVTARMEHHKQSQNSNNFDKSFETKTNQYDTPTTAYNSYEFRLSSNLYNMTYYFDHLNYFPQVGKGKQSWWELGRWYRDQNNSGAEDDKIVDGNGTDRTTSKENYSKPQIPKCIRIGIQPHRNPKQNGITLLFYDAYSLKKVGFILLRHSEQVNEKNNFFASTSLHSNLKSANDPSKSFVSALYGMYIPEHYRGLGMSSLLLSIWLKLCLDMNERSVPKNGCVGRVIPQTEIINKPLLAHVLQNRFGFISVSRKTAGSNAIGNNGVGGIDVQLIPLSQIKTSIPTSLYSYLSTSLDKGTSTRPSRKNFKEPKFALISPTFKSLQGVFSERDLRIQGMILLPRHCNFNNSSHDGENKKLNDEKENGNNKIFRVKAALEHPAFTNFYLDTEKTQSSKCSSGDMRKGENYNNGLDCRSNHSGTTSDKEQAGFLNLLLLEGEVDRILRQDTKNRRDSEDSRDYSSILAMKGGMRYLADRNALKCALFGFVDKSLN